MVDIERSITAESFVFKRNTQKQGRRRVKPLAGHGRNAGRRRTNVTRSREIESSLANTSSEDHDVEEGSNVQPILEGSVIFIDKTLWERQRLTRLALALGAETVDDMQKSVTHIIHSPNPQANVSKVRHPRLVNQALEHNIRIVSPTWLIQCFSQKKRLPELYYPYDVDPQGHHLGQLTCDVTESDAAEGDAEDSENEQENDNPFQLDWDELVSSDDETGTDGNSNLTESSSAQDSVTLSIKNDISTAEDEKARLRRKKERSDDIAKLLAKAREQKQKQKATNDCNNSEPQPPKRERHPKGNSHRSASALPATVEKLEIWYGEQTLCNNNQTSASPIPKAKRGSNRTKPALSTKNQRKLM